MEIPRIISVDDHVVEPPDLWTARLPEKYKGRGPRIERHKVSMNITGGYSFTVDDPAGSDCDVWFYDDLVYPFTRLSAAVGADVVQNEPCTFDDILVGCYDQTQRLADMDANHVEASLCFPNILPRFCGQAFLEREDKELALACIRVYNDWMIDEWCAGAGYGRLIPLTMVPLWDPQLAADEVRRCAAKGSHNITFSENPVPLGLPSVHSGHWEPLFQACVETDTVINMHIGSSSKMPATSPDAPAAVQATLSFNQGMASMADWIFSGILARYPNLKLAYSEAQMGWIPYALERAYNVWKEFRGWAFDPAIVTEPPEFYFRRQIYACFFRDDFGLKNIHDVGVDNVVFETDYPHSDSTWPDTEQFVRDMAVDLDDETLHKIVRGNAIKMLSLDLE